MTFLRKRDLFYMQDKKTYINRTWYKVKRYKNSESQM